MNVALIDNEVKLLPSLDISISTWASRTKITRPLLNASSHRVSEIASKLKVIIDKCVCILRSSQNEFLTIASLMQRI